MTGDEFVRHYPFLYHMGEAGTWRSIRRHGLLSTSALLDLFEVDGESRVAIEERRRPTSVRIEHPQHGHAVIRDQGPICDEKLRLALCDGLSPMDWYRLLNGMVFFWTERDRLERLLSGRRYRCRSHTVLTVDSRRLVEKYQANMILSRINSGAMPYGPTPRGRFTFVPLADWPGAVGPRSGRLKTPVVEAAVRYAVPDIATMVVDVVERASC